MKLFATLCAIIGVQIRLYHFTILLSTVVRSVSAADDECLCNYATCGVGGSSCCDGLECVRHSPFFAQCLEPEKYRPAKPPATCLYSNTEAGCLNDADCCNPTAYCNLNNQICTNLCPLTNPTMRPTVTPTAEPTAPTLTPTSAAPTMVRPTSSPSSQPSAKPTAQPISHPTNLPTSQPSSKPTAQPFSVPTSLPTSQPVSTPTAHPTVQPTSRPSSQPFETPTMQPSSQPSDQPFSRPTTGPSTQPSVQPNAQPSKQPSSQPTDQPMGQPSSQPTMQPSSQPTMSPSSVPTSVPTLEPITFQAQILFVNSSISMLTEEYNTALRMTLAKGMGLNETQVTVIGSLPAAGLKLIKLMELFTVVVDTSIVLPYESVLPEYRPSGEGAVEHIKSMLADYISSGGASIQFRAELSNLKVNYAASITILALDAASPTLMPSQVSVKASSSTGVLDSSNQTNIIVGVVVTIFAVLACIIGICSFRQRGKVSMISMQGGNGSEKDRAKGIPLWTDQMILAPSHSNDPDDAKYSKDEANLDKFIGGVSFSRSYSDGGSHRNSRDSRSRSTGSDFTDSRSDEDVHVMFKAQYINSSKNFSMETNPFRRKQQDNPMTASSPTENPMLSMSDSCSPGKRGSREIHHDQDNPEIRYDSLYKFQSIDSIDGEFSGCNYLAQYKDDITTVKERREIIAKAASRDTADDPSGGIDDNMTLGALYSNQGEEILLERNQFSERNIMRNMNSESEELHSKLAPERSSSVSFFSNFIPTKSASSKKATPIAGSGAAPTTPAPASSHSAPNSNASEFGNFLVGENQKDTKGEIKADSDAATQSNSIPSTVAQARMKFEQIISQRNSKVYRGSSPVATLAPLGGSSPRSPTAQQVAAAKKVVEAAEMEARAIAEREAIEQRAQMQVKAAAEATEWERERDRVAQSKSKVDLRVAVPAALVSLPVEEAPPLLSLPAASLLLNTTTVGRDKVTDEVTDKVTTSQAEIETECKDRVTDAGSPAVSFLYLTEPIDSASDEDTTTAIASAAVTITNAATATAAVMEPAQAIVEDSMQKAVSTDSAKSAQSLSDLLRIPIATSGSSESDDSLQCNDLAFDLTMTNSNGLDLTKSSSADLAIDLELDPAVAMFLKSSDDDSFNVADGANKCQRAQSVFSTTTAVQKKQDGGSADSDDWL